LGHKKIKMQIIKSRMKPYALDKFTRLIEEIEIKIKDYNVYKVNVMVKINKMI
jgi:hypothetical protein